MESKPTPKRPKDQLRDVLRLKRHSYRTEQAQVGWMTRYVLFHDKRHPKDVGIPKVEACLTHLAVEEHVTASTQNQAFSALLFLCREMLRRDLGPVDALRARCPRRLPAFLTQEETRRLLVPTHDCAASAPWDTDANTPAGPPSPAPGSGSSDG